MRRTSALLRSTALAAALTVFAHGAVFAQDARVPCVRDMNVREQAYDFSAQVGRQILAETSEVSVPWRVQFVLKRLVASSSLGSSGRDVRIRGYASEQVAAQASGRDSLLVAEGVWAGALVLSDAEIAGLLAHELAHLEREDMHRWGCFALSLDPRRQSVADAIRATVVSLDDKSTGSLRSSAFLHGLESDADQRAKDILQAAGFPADSLAQLLTRLAAQDASEYPTHPSALVRAHRLR